MDQHFKKTLIIEESRSNYDSLNYEQKLFCDDDLETILGNSWQNFLGSLDAVTGTGKKHLFWMFWLQCWKMQEQGI